MPFFFLGELIRYSLVVSFYSHPVPSELFALNLFSDKCGYFRFKDDRHCSRRIVEVLDPDGKVSPAQISNKLRQLGLKVAPRKKMRYVDEHEGEKKSAESISNCHNSDDLEGSLLNRPL
jgi:hypothetical protein